jgi:hypothetical protein
VREVTRVVQDLRDVRRLRSLCVDCVDDRPEYMPMFLIGKSLRYDNTES